jgi:hypothetical protein
MRIWREQRIFEALPADIRKDTGWRQPAVKCADV